MMARTKRVALISLVLATLLLSGVAEAKATIVPTPIQDFLAAVMQAMQFTAVGTDVTPGATQGKTIQVQLFLDRGFWNCARTGFCGGTDQIPLTDGDRINRSSITHRIVTNFFDGASSQGDKVTTGIRKIYIDGSNNLVIDWGQSADGVASVIEVSYAFISSTAPTPPACGDLKCAVGETPSSCPSDCTIYPPPPPIPNPPNNNGIIFIALVIAGIGAGIYWVVRKRR